jgi:hypothetical protein
METNEPGKIGHVWCLFEKGGKPLGVDIRGIYPEKALMCWALGWSKKCKDLGPPRDVDVAEVEAAIEEKKLPPDFKDEVCILAGRIILEHERFKDLWKSPVSAENEAQLINCIEDS